MPRNYFLAKTDPDTYSIDDFIKEGVTPWDGVHNYQAVNVIKSWKPGDLVFIYHSMGQAKIVGLSEVIDEPRPDENDKRKISWFANLRLIRTYDENQQVSLKDVKASGKFQDFALVKQSRLSTMACPPEFVKWLEKQGVDVSAD
jgi:predicted RNA-binding protein with PUA-like domain